MTDTNFVLNKSHTGVENRGKKMRDLQKDSSNRQ